MDESFCVPDNKYPDGEPGDDWTIEELLHWSLSQYHSKVRDRTSANIESLRNQCEKQCDDVGTLHKLAVDNSIMAKKGSCSNSTAEGIADEENVDPQSYAVSDPAAGVQKATLAKASSTISSSSTVTATAAAASAANKSASSNNSNSNSSGNNKTTIEILVIVGPHAGSKYVLRPKPGAPCHVGRSKGKKFIKNGVSLTRDQEVSTTHGKFVVVVENNHATGTGGIEAAAAAGGGGGGGGGNNNKFYFIDVGSTNGSVYDGEQLEPNDRLPLWSGMELKVGNSVMKIVLG